MTTQEVKAWVQGLIARNNLHAFYTSTAWLHLRAEVLEAHKKDGCLHCKAKGYYTPADTVHHVQFLKKHPELALSKTYMYNGKEYTNLIPLCRDCHEDTHDFRRKKKKEKPLTEERWD